MASPQQQEYLRRRTEEEQRKLKTLQRKKQETPEEAAQRWRRWGKYALFTTAALVILYSSWVYLWPLIYPRVFVPKPFEELTIEEVAADFNDDGRAAEEKYRNKRVVVVGKLVVEPVKKGAPAAARAGRIYFELAGAKGDDARVYCEFFDLDDAESIDPGEEVRISGVIERAGPKGIKVAGASRE
jgi:hypothetical protein